ncbi:MAG: adenosylcobinamide-phosphate synthase CbiB [Shewanella sp.]
MLLSWWELSFADSLLASAIILVLALWLDKFLGEPTRFHPLVGFGHFAKQIECLCRKFTFLSEYKQGVLAWFLAVIPLVSLCVVLTVILAQLSIAVCLVFNVFVLYLTLGGRSLIEHTENIYRALKKHDIEDARFQVSMIVSRNTDNMTEKEITSSAIESALENGNDAVFAPMFWFVLFGASGAVLLRLTNTLDAMWGYKNERYLYFGRLSAKLDDFLGWFPARITAVVYACQGKFTPAVKCWNTQAKECSSPNGGVVMTTGAGALGITIGGPTYYHGVLHDKKPMGVGSVAGWRDIPLANRLVSRGSFYLSYLWLICVLIGVN